jgi:hypothetical protein
MQQDHLNELAQQLYANHKEALDFIFANKPDAVSQVKDYLSSKINIEGYVEGSRSKRFLRFTTRELDNLLLRKGDGFGGWDRREQFLFEFEFSVQSSNQLIVIFRTSVHPRGDQDIRRILIEVIGSLDMQSSSRFSVKTIKRFDVKDITERIDDNSMNDLFDTEWPGVVESVSDVSRAILNRSEEIKAIYSASSPG